MKVTNVYVDIHDSTRRKALYKHIFQKVDKDRDNLITFKVCILYNHIMYRLFGNVRQKLTKP